MSGHSKWKTIQHKKSLQDAKRGKLFSKLSKELAVVARQGGSDPSTNAALRNLIHKARSVNMPQENILRAIKKGTGELEGSRYEEVIYEGFVAGGVGVVVVALTDNKNRAAAEIRHIFNRHGANLAAQGAVARGFQRRGQIFVDASTVDEDRLMSIALEAGADDLRRDGDQYEILTDPAVFTAVTEALEKAGIKPTSAEVGLVPNVYTPVTDKAVASAVMKLVADLEENDDVQNVYTNMDVDDAVLKELG